MQECVSETVKKYQFESDEMLIERLRDGERDITDFIMNKYKNLVRSKAKSMYILGADTEDLDEKLGYCGADLILYAQTLGLNTWWVGGMYNGNGAKKNLKNQNVRVNGVIAVGYGQTQGVQHKMKM